MCLPFYQLPHPHSPLAPKEVGSFLLFFSEGRLSASTDSKPWLFLAFLQSGLLSRALTMQLSLMTTTNYWCQEHCLELFHESIDSHKASALAFCMLCHKHQRVKLKSCFATDDLSRQRLLLLDVSPCNSCRQSAFCVMEVGGQIQTCRAGMGRSVSGDSCYYSYWWLSSLLGSASNYSMTDVIVTWKHFHSLSVSQYWALASSTQWDH